MSIEVMKQASDALWDMIHFYQTTDENYNPLPPHNQPPEIKRAIESFETLRQAIKEHNEMQAEQLKEN